MADWADMKITDGTDQADRVSPALQSGYFNVDEMVFEQLLAMGAELAAQINYFNLQNQVDGSWEDLFTADEAVIIAMILSTNLKQVEAEFVRLSDVSLELQADFVLQWTHKINFWLNRLNRTEHPSGVALRQKIRGVVEEKLRAELHTLAELVAQINKEKVEPIKVDWLVFGKVWNIKQVGVEYYFPHSNLGQLNSQNQLRQRLRTVFYVFLNAVSYLKTIAPIYLQQSLGSGQHDPAVGLYMVFLKLYQKAQQTINQFSQKHLDFYYNKILRVQPRGKTPEKQFLLLENVPGIDQTLVKKGVEFTPGKDAELNDILFSANTELLSIDAKVASLATLYLEHDPLVSPETEIGYVSRIKSATPLQGIERDNDAPWPLFGVEKNTIRKRRADDAQMGFAIASPLLLLREGERKIDLRIVLEDGVKADADLMVSMLGNTDAGASFIKLFGRLFSRYLLASDGWLSMQQKTDILNKAESLLDQATFNECKHLLMQDWQGLFYKLFKKTFHTRLTTESGWLEVEDCYVEPLSNVEGDKADVAGIRIVLNLAQELDPVVAYSVDVHGNELDTALPVLECRINPQTNFYPYSLFDDVLINSLDIRVEVIGIKNILAYNQHGQLDPSKPFQPFGPLPSTNSYFVMGNFEIANKNVSELNLRLEWGELPMSSTGFAGHYAGYETSYSNEMFCASVVSLVDGRWQTRDNDVMPAISLFNNDSEGGVAEQKYMSLDLAGFFKPIDVGLSEDEYVYSLSARNGFVKLSLAEPASAFGHAEYPALLTKVLSENARSKKPVPPPNPPYTPLLNGISLGYKAAKKINFFLGGGDVAVNQSMDSFFHIHPFGVETVYPARRDKPCYLLPQYAYSGNLFVGLKAAQLSGPVTLFFHLSEDLLQEASAHRPQISWFYLASDVWKRLKPVRVLSDTTEGFMSSGIITLDIPADISSDNHVMPHDLFWLRVSVKDNVHLFCHCYSVQTNGLELSRTLEQQETPVTASMPAQSKWSGMAALPGIGAIHQVGVPFGGRSAEDEAHTITRVSERLRHKNRASLPWDYERLVLEKFPQVAKVKCFSNMSSSQLTPRPGHVLLVVVPHAQSGKGEACGGAMLSAVELSQIHKYICQHASPFVQIEVRNPVYEEVQVRCTVKFSGRASGGAYINQLNQDITDYICPWQRLGYKTRFGWIIRQKDVESYIRGLEYVDFVTNFSMLHITADAEGRYSLCDTAKQQQDNQEVIIRPRFPWSLAIPARHHFIETMQEAHFIKAEVTGVDELEVGATFIISGNGDNGEEE